MCAGFNVNPSSTGRLDEPSWLFEKVDTFGPFSLNIFLYKQMGMFIFGAELKVIFAWYLRSCFILRLSFG